MSNKFRLSSGGQVNRTERISFKFNLIGIGQDLSLLIEDGA